MTSFLKRLAQLSFATALSAVLGASTLGCGRSDLIDYEQGYLADASADGTTDAPSSRCTSSDDCATTPTTPYCELPQGVCVACLTNPDTCPTGEACNPTTHVCVKIASGCTSNAQCPATKPICDTATGDCVGCLVTPQCPTGDICQDFDCVPSCGGGEACTNGLSCCNGGCLDEANDPSNCGGCGNVCQSGLCIGGICQPTAGCETTGCALGDACCSNVCVNVESSTAHCGSCTNRCGANQTCVDGTCQTETTCNGGPSCGALTCCGTQGCVDTNNDTGNCGGCGIMCALSQGCIGGICQGVSCACPGNLTCCSEGELDLCTNIDTDPNNCGGCGISCNGGACSQGMCVNMVCACPVGDICCAATTNPICVNPTVDPDHCGGCNIVCPPDSKCLGATCIPTTTTCNGGPPCSGVDTCCGDGCTDTQTDPKNCSECGFICPTGDTCVQGNCTPPANCDGGPVCTGMEQCCSTGCKNIDTDPKNCGACGNTCPATFTCVAATCTAPASCNGGPVCTGVNQCCASGCSNVNTDPNNCGSCGNACAPGDTCQGGTCQAPATCNGGPLCTATETCCASGCSNTTTDASNCGGCGTICPTGDTCVASICTPATSCNGAPPCPSGDTCCGTGCSNTTSDPKNCGGCGTICPTGDTCVGSVCTSTTSCNGGPPCPTGDICCPTGCLNDTSDPNNCGGCGVICGGGDMCVDSMCTNNEGPFNPTENPTYLSPGAHAYSTINIPAGITVYVAGAGANSGTLSLSATGAVVIDGVINLSGGPGTQNTITSQNTEAGEAGGGGYTGEPYESAPGSAACSFIGGNGGSLGDAVSGGLGACQVASSTVCISQDSNMALLFTAPLASYGGGGGVFTGYRAYGAGGGGPAGGAPGALGPAYPGESDCSGVSGGGGATNGKGGAGSGVYAGGAGILGQTQCAGLDPGVPAAYVGGGGGGAIGAAASADLPVATTFQTGSAGGGGSADYLNRPEFGGTSGGGGGGGALKIASATSITIGGQVLANGGVGGDAVIGIGSDAMCNPQPGAAGGGGSGGVIYLAAPTLSVASGATVSAAGGAGGAGSEFATGGAGGAGGMGRIRLSVTAPSCSSLSGSFTPALPAGCTAGAATAGKTYIGVYPN